MALIIALSVLLLALSLGVALDSPRQYSAHDFDQIAWVSAQQSGHHWHQVERLF